MPDKENRHSENVPEPLEGSLKSTEAQKDTKLKQTKQPQPPQFDPEEEHDFKVSNRFVWASGILGIAGLVLGSILFSLIGLFCGIWGYRKLRILGNKQAEINGEIVRMKRNAILAIIVNGIAIIFCAAMLTVLLPNAIEVVSGDFSSLFSNAETASNATWG